MNVESLRDFCLSLGENIEERMPFGKFKAAQSVLAFYVGGHIFCFFDIDRFEVVTVKCQSERTPDLTERYDGIVEPYNMSPKHWIGIRPELTDDKLMQELVENSYQLIKTAYQPKKKN